MAEDNHLEKIQQIILDLSGEAAFSAEAMKQFVELKDELDSVERTNNYLREQHKEAKDELAKEKAAHDKTRDKVGDLNSELTDWRKRLTELEDREGQHTELKVRHEMNEQRVRDHQQMFATVFKGIHMRRQVVTPGYAGHTDQSGYQHYGEGSQTHDLEDKEE